MYKYFGQDFTYAFYPLKADGVHYELLPDSPDSIYIFDGYPSLSDAQSGVSTSSSYSLVEAISDWEDTPDGLGKQFDVSAIDEPSTSQGDKSYYAAINTELQPGNPLPPIIREIKLTRLRVQDSAIDVKVSDLFGIEPTLKIFCDCAGDLEAYIDAATLDIRASLVGCDFSHVDLWDPAVLNRAVIKKAISKFFLGQSRQTGDVHFGNGMRYEEEYRQAMGQVTLLLDKDKDGKPEEKRQPSPGVFSIRMRR